MGVFSTVFVFEIGSVICRPGSNFSSTAQMLQYLYDRMRWPALAALPLSGLCRLNRVNPSLQVLQPTTCPSLRIFRSSRSSKPITAKSHGQPCQPL